VQQRPAVDGRRWFFMHVPKTGGSTFNAHIQRCFSAGEIWPAHEPKTGPLSAATLYTSLACVRSMSIESRTKTRVFRGHFPFDTVDLLGHDVIVTTLLREPVDRTVSWLDHCRRNNPEHRDLSLEQIYDDDWFTARYARNLQTKAFAMTLDEATAVPAETIVAGTTARHVYETIGCALNAVVEINDSRFADAQSRMDRVDVLGVTERYADFCGRLAERGWTMSAIAPRNVGEPRAITDALRRRIVADNQYDIELYERAVAAT
jgi:hypothetical protein